jgi:hypothetical protein
MNVEIGAEAALFPEKEYINGIAVAVWDANRTSLMLQKKSNRTLHYNKNFMFQKT